MTSEIPASELTIQWDVCYELLDIEGVVAWMGDGAWERFAGPVTRLTRLIPEDALVGYQRRGVTARARTHRPSRNHGPGGRRHDCQDVLLQVCVDADHVVQLICKHPD